MAAVTCSSGGLTDEEWARRDRRKLSYHLLGTKNRLPRHVDDEYDDPLFRYLTSGSNKSVVLQAKIRFLRALAQAGEDVTDPTVRQALEELCALYDPSVFDARQSARDDQDNPIQPGLQQSTASSPPRVEGMWIALVKPKFMDGMGINDKKEYIYSLKRLSFGKFYPSDLVCSLQGTFNPVQSVVRSRERAAIARMAPPDLQEEIKDKNTLLRTYDVVTAFTIEPGSALSGDLEAKDPSSPTSPNAVVDRPIEGLLTTHGYMLPNPDHSNRLTVFFTSGSLEVAAQEDVTDWKKVFHRVARTPGMPAESVSTTTTPDTWHGSTSTKPSRRGFLKYMLPKFKSSKQQLQADSHNPAIITNHGDPVVVPIEADGKMSYQLDQPVGGHDSSYVDVLYLDDTLRILRGSRGDLHVEARVLCDKNCH